MKIGGLKLSYKENNESFERIKKFVVKIEIVDERDQVIKSGTGFFVDFKHVITARHVVSEALDPECSLRVSYSFNGIQTFQNAIVIYEAPSRDVNIVELMEPIQLDIHSEFPKIVQNSFRKREFKYCAYGYPASKPEGHSQQGIILDEYIDINGDRIIDVSLGEGRLTDYRGYSGSPVICNGQLIGLAIEQTVGLNTAQSIKVLDFSSAIDYLEEDWLCFDDFVEEIICTFQRESIDEIARNKANGKYVPEIFIELGTMKEYLRGLSDPVLFFEKHLDYIRRHNFEQYNLLLERYGLTKIQFIEGENEVSLDNVKNISEEMIIKLKDMLTYVTKLTRSSDIRENVPDEYLELFDLTFHQHRLMGLEWELRDRISFFESLKANQILLTEKAGQGKTNLLCDFTENVLLRKGIPCFFIGMRNLIDDDISKTMINYYKYDLSIEELFKVLDFYSQNVQKPFVIVLDAINEQKDVINSKNKLYSFLNQASSFNNVKVIMTARTEYFDEKFGDISDKCPQVEQFTSYNWKSQHSKLCERVFHGYMEHFNIEIHDIDDLIYEQLSKDFLLLRMFSEAYHGLKESPTIIPALLHLFRYEIFEKYYNYKRKSLKEWDRHHGVYDGGSTYDSLINIVTDYMIQNIRFSNIERSLIVEKVQNNLLVKLIDEDIIFRDDIKKTKGLIEKSVEVINFTFDEFRDFCLAKKIIENFDDSNHDESIEVINNLTQDNLEISEGVQKYLFFASKKHQNDTFTNIIIKQKWFNHIYFNNIFSVSEEFILERDVTFIKRLLTNMNFYEKHLGIVIMIYSSLIRRYNTHVYSKLNIRLLITIFENIDDSDFRMYVHDIFSSSYEDRFSYYGRKAERIPIDMLVKKLKYYMRKSFNEDIVIFLSYLHYRGIYIHDFFDWCIEKFSNQCIEMFENLIDVNEEIVNEVIGHTVQDLSCYELELDHELIDRWENIKKRCERKMNVDSSDLSMYTDQELDEMLKKLESELGIWEED